MPDYLEPEDEWAHLDDEADALIDPTTAKTPEVVEKQINQAQSETIVEKTNIPEKSTPDTSELNHDAVDGLTATQWKERYDNATARMHQAIEEANTLRKSTSDTETLQTALDNALNELATLKTQAPVVPVTSPDGASDDALNSLAEDYEQFKPLVEEMKAQRAQLKQQGQAAESTAKSAQLSAKADNERVHMDAIVAAHADAMDIHGSAEFNGWLARQPAYIKQAVDNGSAADVIDLLDRYKLSTGHGSNKVTEDKLKAARTIADNAPAPSAGDGQAKPRFTQEQIGRMTQAEYDANEDAIDEWMKDGGAS